jgi:hypothetical protein
MATVRTTSPPNTDNANDYATTVHLFATYLGVPTGDAQNRRHTQQQWRGGLGKTDERAEVSECIQLRASLCRRSREPREQNKLVDSFPVINLQSTGRYEMP